VLRAALGAPVVDVFSVLKRDEVARYENSTVDPGSRDVTPWEIQEYLEDY
jgi:glutamine synthetase